MNSTLTRRVHSQEKACPSTHTNPGNAVMTQLIACLDEHLLRKGAIFFVTVLRNAFRKSLETHGMDNVKSYSHNPEMKVSHFGASHGMSCNIFTHLAWLITDAYLEVGNDGLLIPNNKNKLSTLPTMSFQHQST